MIDIQHQEDLLLAIGNLLQKKLNVYAIGETALMLRGIKNSTLDIDLVFDKKSDRAEFINALKKLGAKESDTTLVYGLKKHTPIMLGFDNYRFDMFLNNVINSTFSDTMKERSTQTHEFNNLLIKVADPNDILLMKSATSREKDLEDIIAIANKNRIDWNLIIEESKKQVNLGNEKSILNLGEKLEKLSNQKAVVIPKEILDTLWELLNKQIKTGSVEKSQN